MENTLSSLFASVEWRQLPWLQPSEVEAWFEARGATGTKWLLMVRLYKWFCERVIYRRHFYVGQQSRSATNDQFHIIPLCQRRLRLMKQDKSHQVICYSPVQSTKYLSKYISKWLFCVVFFPPMHRLLKSHAETSSVHQSKCRLSTQHGVHPGGLQLNTKQEKARRSDCCLCFSDRKRLAK